MPTVCLPLSKQILEHLCPFLCRLGCVLLLRLREGVLPPAAFLPAIGHKSQEKESFHEDEYLDLKPLRK